MRLLRVATVLALCAAPFEVRAAEVSLRLRVAWGGGNECLWRGAIRLSNGTLTDARPLGIETDEAGTIYLDARNEPGGVVHIEPKSPRSYDGVDVTVTADESDRLLIELSSLDPASDTGDSRKSVEIALVDLIQQSSSTPLDETKNRLLVMRAPGDKLRVDYDRPHLVFDPGERFNLHVTPHQLGLPPGTPLRVRVTLAPVTLAPGAARERLWQTEFDTLTPSPRQAAAPQPVEAQLPNSEGVYDMTIAVVESRFTERLWWRKPLAERKVQLVVLGPKSPIDGAAAAAKLTKLLEIDPANPRWYERIANISAVGWLKRPGTLGSGDSARWEHPALGPLVQLGQSKAKRRDPAAPDEYAWEAYPLPISEPGKPHLLEVEYPSDVPQVLALSVIEPNASGSVVPIGLDSGVYVSDDAADDPPRLLKHKLVFWPRTKQPVLLVTNRRPNARAAYGKLRVLTWQSSQFAVLPLTQKSGGSASLPRSLASEEANRAAAQLADLPPSAEQRGQERLFAGYLDRPLLSENFLAPESLDVFSRRSLDDWTTFYLGSRRLMEYLHHVGYNGLVMSVLAEGGAIYPSTQFQSTPRFDTGTIYATGQDPQPKDVLELLLRDFDREGLRLIPALQLTAPIAELESLARAAKSPTTGIHLIGADGRTYVERMGTNLGAAPYYNPLHPQVQRAMTAIVGELAERYGQHPAFAGVALQLSADGFTQFPGVEWPLDDHTMARFCREAALDSSAIKQLSSTNDDRFAARAHLISGRLKDTWLAWRAAQLTALYRQMRVEIAKHAPQAKLVLLGAGLYEGAPAQRALRPALPRRVKVDELLLTLGLQADTLARLGGVKLPRPYRLAPSAVAANGAVDGELNRADDVMQLYSPAISQRWAQLYHEPVRTRLASFDEASPFGAANTFTWLVTQFVPAAERNRKRFTHAVAASDAAQLIDGGWMLPLGQEDTLLDLISTYRQLPAEPFTALPEPSEPVAIRTLIKDQQTFIYLANDSPWQVRVSLGVEGPEGMRYQALGGTRKLPALVRQAGAGTRWTLELAPYELVAARFESPDVRFDRPEITLEEQVAVNLERRISDLSARVAALASPAPIAVLRNPGFEAPLEASALVGWTTAAPVGTQVELDARTFHAGGQSLHITSTGPRASMRSEAIDAPATGRLSVALWIKLADKSKQPTLRLAVECRADERDYYRYAAVGGNGPNQVPLTDEWAQYIYQVDDLPTHGVRDLRLRFDLMTTGDLWLDDVQVYDLSFSNTERVELSKIVSLADYKRTAGEYASCLQILESHWPTFLVEHVPLAQGPNPLARRPDAPPAAGPPAPAPAKPEKSPGMFDRLRGIFGRGEK
jgi:hypothetical protein